MLEALRGMDTLTAVGLCAEIGDFARFAKAGQLMSYLGLVPSEHSTGESRRLGSTDPGTYQLITPDAVEKIRDELDILGRGACKGDSVTCVSRRVRRRFIWSVGSAAATSVLAP
jgi:transposase